MSKKNSTGDQGFELRPWHVKAAAVAAAALISPVALVVAWLVERACRRWPDRLMVAALAAATLPVAALGWSVGSWVAVARPALAHLPVPADAVSHMVASGLAVGPSAGAIWWQVWQRWRETDRVTGARDRGRRRQAEAARVRWTTHAVQALAWSDRRRAGWAARRVAVPEQRAGGVVLGRWVTGTLTSRKFRRGRVAILPPQPVEPHVVVMGATGKGKSEVAWRIVADSLATGGQVIYLNCKQVPTTATTAQRMAAEAATAGVTWQALSEASPWRALQGDTRHVRQLLLSTQVWGDEYYEHVSSVLLALALELATEAGQPIESAASLAMELLHGRLQERVASSAHPDQARQLLAALGAAEVRGAVTRWLAAALSLGPWTSALGWSWEDARATAVDLPSTSEPVAARALLRVMLTSLASWVTSDRRPVGPDGRPRPLVLVIDDVGAADADPIVMRRIAGLAERVRGAGVRVVVIGQGPVSLGDPATQEALLTNCVVVTGSQAEPDVVERLARMAGTARVVESSRQWSEGDAVEVGSSRLQHAWSLDPDVLRELRRGEVIVMSQGRWARVAVAMTQTAYRMPPPQPVSLPSPPTLELQLRPSDLELPAADRDPTQGSLPELPL